MEQSIQVASLNNLLNSKSVNQISNDGVLSDNIKTNINGFIEDNTILKGFQWLKVRNKLSKYNNLLDKRVEVASSLSSAISSAIKLLLDYLGDDLELDPSKLDELIETRKRYEELVVSLESRIESMEMVKVTQGDGRVSYKMEYVYNSYEREQMRRNIEEIRTEIIPELNKLIEKIEGLPAIYEQAKTILSAARNDIFKFSNRVGLVTPSTKI